MATMRNFIQIAYHSDFPDPRGQQLLRSIHTYFGFSPSRVRCHDILCIDSNLSPAQLNLACRYLADPICQVASVGGLPPPSCDYIIDVAFRNGVTDSVGHTALVILRDMFPDYVGDEAQVRSSKRYFITGVDLSQSLRIASDLLANKIIEEFSVRSSSASVESKTQHVAIRATSSSGTSTFSHEELTSIQSFFAQPQLKSDRNRLGLPASPTLLELECIAQTWSEHCKHKIFNATIEYVEGENQPVLIHSLFDHFIKASTKAIAEDQLRKQSQSFLVSVFDDNAGVITFDDCFHLVFKVETHNSPSALDPYGGAMTGIVGVNRDPFGTGLGAELLCNTYGYCLGDPDHADAMPPGLLHPRRVREGVHRGVIEGGNHSGIPTARGFELFDSRYLGKPLVFCGTVGRLPCKVASKPAHLKNVPVGSKIVMCGGRIGKDGIHGATFSSEALHDQSPVQAVQIGSPITQKCMFDFLIEARDRGLYSAITDNGAGGLSSSVGELCTFSNGARLDLSKAKLKYPGLEPWEILVSEAQERMTLAVPDEHLQEFLELSERREVESCVLGEFTDSGILEVYFGDELHGYLPLDFLHHGLPTMKLKASWSSPAFETPSLSKVLDFTDDLHNMLRGLNLSSTEAMGRHYDHGVKGLTVIPPWIGLRSDLPSDASVFLVHHGSFAGYVISEAINPFQSELDTRWMTATVIDEAIRKAISAGARLDHLAGLDNYCWPDPVECEENPDASYKLGQLVRSVSALAEFCQAYGVPCISGKDSMKNDSRVGGVKISILPSLLFSVIGKIDDVRLSVSADVKQAGALVYLLGVSREELGASELLRSRGLGPAMRVPKLEPSETLPLYRAVEQAIRRGMLQSCHALGRGGLAVGLAMIAMGGELGLEVELEADEHLRELSDEGAMFGESNGRFVVTVEPSQVDRFEALMAGRSVGRIGRVSESTGFYLCRGGRCLVKTDVMGMKGIWKGRFGG